LSAALRLPSAFALALVVTVLTVPAAISIARRWGLLDHPRGWKHHAQPTPYLGGAALLCGFSIAGAAFAASAGLAWLLACCGGLCILGTLDDRWGLPASLRLAATMVVAVVLWSAGLGWSIFSSEVANLTLSIIWILLIVNAVNLLDLLDGAAATTVAVCAAACAAVAGVFSDVPLAALALALCGSCLGFLRHNLRSPAAIFLGDGGTMPIGLSTAVLIETLPWGRTSALAAISGSVLLCGLPIFDLTFRIISRLHRGDTLLTAGPDSVANWLRARVPSARWTALCLGLGQATLGSVAVLAADLGSDALLTAGLCTLLLGAILVILLDVSGFGRHLLADRAPTGRRGSAAPRPTPLMDASGDPGSRS
jgi:UDP-GlcNAc:undecaprenyl-phosphate/decaprenyl-phosphate GlcNAc-1-phosphate transferase